MDFLPAFELLILISFGVTCAEPLEVVFIPKYVIFLGVFVLLC